MTKAQREAMDELIGSLYDIGYSYGLEGTTAVHMLASVANEIGESPLQWMVRPMLEGYDAGIAERNVAREEKVVVRIATDALPF